jgi:DNA-binding transcriptional regulator YhcF (GntR family)
MNFKENQPIYIQIAELACERILLGQWPPGSRIPSMRDLAIEVQVNPNTVVRSYEFLEQKGIIVNRRGVGYFADEEAPHKIRTLRREQFLNQELPVFLRSLHLLDIPFKEIEQRYRDYQFE